MILLAALLALPAGFGAPYPHGKLDAAPEQRECSVRYQFKTADSMLQVATFYRVQAAKAGVRLLDDFNAKFPDFRMLVFKTQPRFMAVAMSLAGGHTNASVSFTTSEADC